MCGNTILKIARLRPAAIAINSIIIILHSKHSIYYIAFITFHLVHYFISFIKLHTLHYIACIKKIIARLRPAAIAIDIMLFDINHTVFIMLHSSHSSMMSMLAVTSMLSTLSTLSLSSML